MKRIISIQHCESIHHTNGMIGSWTDWELSENGIVQAHSIGKKLKKEYKDKYIVYTSDLKRASQTANIIGTYIDSNPIEVFELRELNLGSAVGKSSKWCQENAKPFEFDVDFKCLEDAESTRDHYIRIKPFIDQLLANDEENIIIVSHGGTASVIHNIFMDLPVEHMNILRIHSGAGSLSKYVVENGTRKIYAIGDTSYRK